VAREKLVSAYCQVFVILWSFQEGMAVEFCFYPRHEYACPNVRHCPHLGGAALGSLVLAANENDEAQDYLHRQLDAERERSSRLFEENESLKKQLAQAKLELKLERQTKFATNRQQRADAGSQTSEPVERNQGKERKRGAPIGHPAWYRPRPTAYDLLVEVAAPECCPHCQGPVSEYRSGPAVDHLQEDLIDRHYQVTLFRHPQARCRRCRRWVQQAGEGELLGSRIGPQVRSLALYLRHDIGISVRKVPRAMEEMFGIRFVPATLLAFERLLAGKAQPLVEDICKKVASSEGAVHADETYWTLDGARSYYWIHATDRYIHFQFDTTRAGEVSRDLLGEDFTGTLVTDCYSAYDAQGAKAKQKCLAHLARTARDWQKLTAPGSPDYRFFEEIKCWVKHGCAFGQTKFSGEQRLAEAAWLRTQLDRLLSYELSHEKALTLQERIRKYKDCWLVFLDDARVPPTNNHAERCLRPLVILRKITFGHRTRAAAVAMARLMTIKETAKRHGRRVLDIFSRLHTGPPEGVLRYLYAGSVAAGKNVVNTTR
jgi:hypothetical protein